MMRKISLVAMALLLVISTGAQSQNPAPGNAGQGAPPKQQNPIISRTYTVIVPVTVKDGSGQLVAGLTREDFRVFSDNIEQKIAGFSADPVPLSAVVLIDNDLGARAVDQVQKSLTTISAAFGPSDEVALVTYEQFTETVSDF